MSGDLKGQKPVIGLPFTVSKQARRKALMTTGVQVDQHQVMEVHDLLDVADEQSRERLVDNWERIEVEVSEQLGDPAPEGVYYCDRSFELKAYQWLRRSDDSWAAGNDEGDSIEIDRVFVPTPDRTVNIAERARLTLDNGREIVDALLAGRPLVDALDDDRHLTLEIVLGAYDRALALAAELVEQAWSTPIPDDGILWDVAAWDDERILMVSAGEHQRRPPLGFARESDPDAFDEALKLLKTVNGLSPAALKYFVFRSCDSAHNVWISNPNHPPTDKQIVKLALIPSAGGAQRHHEGQLAEKKVKTDYVTDRDAWIAEFGSNRLRLAAQRGYRHDGLYRDERLAAELPGFIGNIGRRAEVKEIVNPSEDALELETEVLKQIKRQGLEVKVRLVWMKADVDLRMKKELQDGEYVEIEGYLSRHKVYKPVDEEPDFTDDDIPF